MNWVAVDLLMFGSSVILYLAARKAALMKLPVLFTNLAMFGVPLLAYISIAWHERQHFAVTYTQAALMILAGITLAYLSNRASLRSIEWAPNPGYSLVISKSYVVFTTIAAVSVFGAELKVRSMLAIAAIVLAAAILSLNPRESHKAQNGAWLPLALWAFFGWGMLSLVAKYLFTQGLTPAVFLSFVSTTSFICIVVENSSKNSVNKQILQHWRLFLFIGLAATAFNLSNFGAISLAPNVGYVNATNAASIGAVTVFSILLFGDEFSWRKLLGVAGVIAGLLVLLLP